MNTKFIKLTNSHGGNVFVNPIFVTSIEEPTEVHGHVKKEGSIVNTMGGTEEYVKENPEDVINLINKTEKYTTFKDVGVRFDLL